jgi:hypothetical protein
MAVALNTVEVPMHTYKAKRANGQEVLIFESWHFVDMSIRRTGTEWVPSGEKRHALQTGETVRLLDEGVFQLTATSEILKAI